jgi:nickel-type superoxide dismutase maturation protease
MAPTLVPGDRLLVERLTFRLRAPRRGDLVLAADPRAPGRELVKRVAHVDGDAVTLRGDNRSASTDSLAFGDVPRGSIAWRVARRVARERAARPRAPWAPASRPTEVPSAGASPTAKRTHG